MTEKLRPIRRVVTGNDGQGRSRVLFDSAAPNVNPGAVSASAGMTDIWVFHSCPALISGERDDGKLPFHFEPPEKGGHLRIVQSVRDGRRTTMPAETLPPCPCTRRGEGRAEPGTAVDRTPTARPSTSRRPSITASFSKASACCSWTTASAS